MCSTALRVTTAAETRLARPKPAKTHQYPAKRSASARSAAETGRLYCGATETTIGNAMASAKNVTAATNSARTVTEETITIPTTPAGVGPEWAARGLLTEDAVTMDSDVFERTATQF